MQKVDKVSFTKNDLKGKVDDKNIPDYQRVIRDYCNSPLRGGTGNGVITEKGAVACIQKVKSDFYRHYRASPERHYFEDSEELYGQEITWALTLKINSSSPVFDTNAKSYLDALLHYADVLQENGLNTKDKVPDMIEK